MSNLPINNAMPMSHNYLAQNQEQPVVDKARNQLLSKTFENQLILDNGAGQKDGTVMVSRDALERLFDMFESAFRAIRSMLSGQGLPKPMPEGALPKSQPEGDLKEKLLKDIVSTISPEVPGKPTLSTAGKPDAKLPVEPPLEKAGLRADDLPKVRPEGKSDAKLPVEQPLEKAGPQADGLPKVRPENKSQSPVYSGSDLKMQSEAGRITKMLSGEATAVQRDTAQESKQASDVNVTVQIINCGFHQHEMSAVSSKSKSDGQSPVVPNTPLTPKSDGQTPVVRNTPITPKSDGQTPVVPNTPVTPKPDGQTPVVPNTPVTPKPDGQSPVVPNTPITPKSDGQTPVVPNTPITPKSDGQTPVVPNTPVTPKSDGQTPVVPNAPVTPKSDDQSPVVPNTPVTPQPDGQSPLVPHTHITPDAEGQPSVTPQPELTFGPRSRFDVTAPGPADDIFNSRNRNRFDNFWSETAARQTRA